MNFYILNRDEVCVETLTSEGYEPQVYSARFTEKLNEMSTLELELTNMTGFGHHVKEENYIICGVEPYRWEMFVIKRIEEAHGLDHTLSVYAEHVSQELLDCVCNWEIMNRAYSPTAQLTEILKGTRWALGRVDDPAQTHACITSTINKSVLEAVHSLRNEYGLNIKFEVAYYDGKVQSRKVSLVNKVGVDRYKTFEYSKDVERIVREVDTTDIKTAIIPVGGVPKGAKEGTPPIDISTVVWTTPTNPVAKPAGVKYLEDKNATALWGYGIVGEAKRPRYVYWENSEITDKNALIREAWKILQTINVPKVNYTMDVMDLLAMSGYDLATYGHEEVNLGDTVNVIDREFYPLLAVRTQVISREVDLLLRENPKVELGSVIKTVANGTLSNTLGGLNAVNTQVQVLKNSVDYLNVDKVSTEQLTAQVGRIDNLESTKATITDLEAVALTVEGKADIANLNAEKARIDTLTADLTTTNNLVANKADITSLNAEKARIDTLRTDLTTTNNLVAQKADITALNAEKARIDTLNTNLTTTNNLVAEKATITALNTEKARIDTLNTNLTTTNNLVAQKATITALDAEKARIDTLNTNLTTTNNLVATKADITALDAEKARINTLETNLTSTNTLVAKKADITSLDASNARINTLESDTAALNNLVAGRITSANMAVGAIKAGDAVIANSAIGNAHIASLDAGKLTAGTVDTSKVTIQGTNARMKITGNRLQVFATKADNSLYERVALGDVNGNGTVYGFRVRGADGTTTLLDENGVKREGITDGSINNAKIGADANISGAKLDIASVVTAVNNGTTTITGSKIAVNGSTLDVQFTSLKDTVTSQGNTISTHSSQISSNTNAITLKVDSSTFNTYKSTNDQNITSINSTLSSHSSSIDVLEGEIALKVSQSDLDTVNNNVGALETRMTSAESSITQNANAISLKVSTSTYNAGIATKEDTITKSATAPTSPATNKLWMDTSVTPNVLKRWTGTVWAKVTPTTASEVGAYSATDGSALAGRVTSAESSITQQANSIALKVDTTTYNSGLATKESAISKATTAPASPATNALWLDTSVTPNQLKRWTGTAWVKATPSTAGEVGAYSSADGTALATRVTSAESSIDVLEGQIALKVSSSDFNSYKTTNDSAVGDLTSRMSSAELKITDSAIVSTVRNSTSYTADLSAKANQSALDTTNGNVTTALNTANSKRRVFTATPTTPYDIGDLWTQGTAGDLMKCKVARASGAYTATDWEKASKYTDDTKANAVQTNLNTTNSNLTALTTRVTDAESSITQHSDAIALKVSQSDYNGNTIASLINQTATTITISASKINLTGAVTISSLDSATATKVNNGNNANTTVNSWKHASDTTKIDGGDIYTGSITADKINTKNLKVSSTTGASYTVMNGDDLEMWTENGKLGIILSPFDTTSGSGVLLASEKPDGSLTYTRAGNKSKVPVNGVKGEYEISNCYSIDLNADSDRVYVNGKKVATENYVASNYAPTDSPTFTGTLTADVVRANTKFENLGRLAMFTWSGTIASANSVFINHNLGYKPMVKFSGTVGNVVITTADVDTNQMRIYCYGNAWTGTVNFY